MKARSAQNKGLRLENYLVEVLREQVDKKTYKTPASGSGLDKNDIRISDFDIEIEAKNSKSIHLITDWEQLQRQLTTGNKGVLAIRNPKKPEFKEILIVMSFGDWIENLQMLKGEVKVISSQDNELKYAVKNLKENCSKVLKKLT